MSIKDRGAAILVIAADGLRKKVLKLNMPLPVQPANCAIYHYVSHWPVLFSQTNDDAQAKSSFNN